MKRVLFVANIDEHIRAFHQPYLRFFKENGWEVCVASRGSLRLPFCDRKFDIPLERFPFKPGNIRAFIVLLRIFRQNRFDIVHFHTDTVHVLGMIALLLAGKRDTRVLFTSHGHYYYQGSPFLSWLLYFPIDCLLARFTDCLITINREDFELSRRRHKARSVEYVHGVGFRQDDFRPPSVQEKQLLRKQYDYCDADYLILYAAEFTKNKNQRLLIQTVHILHESIPGLKLLLAGGDSGEYGACVELCRQLGVSDRVQFLGHRGDIPALLQMCDAVAASSRKEGLPVNIMEALACGLPVCATDNRGHRELIRDGENGLLTEPDSPRSMARALLRLNLDPMLARRLGEQGEKSVRPFALALVYEKMTGIYRRYL